MTKPREVRGKESVLGKKLSSINERSEIDSSRSIFEESKLGYNHPFSLQQSEISIRQDQVTVKKKVVEVDQVPKFNFKTNEETKESRVKQGPEYDNLKALELEARAKEQRMKEMMADLKRKQKNLQANHKRKVKNNEESSESFNTSTH